MSPCSYGTWTTLQPSSALFTADLSACGSNHNYALIDYLQGSRKALMDLILNPPPLRYLKCVFGVVSWETRVFSFLQDGQLKLVSVSEWGSPAHAAVTWDYGTVRVVRRKGDGNRRIPLQWLPDGPKFSYCRIVLSFVNSCSIRGLNVASL